MMLRLFIGGPANGRRLMVDERMTEIFVPVPKEPEPIDRFDPIEPEPTEQVMYVLNRIAGSKSMFAVYAPAGWEGDQIVSALIRRYPEGVGR